MLDVATAGLSPAALGAAYLDCAVHLIVSPGRQLKLAGAANVRMP